ncbi:hypothetical protein [Ketogulonicigenium vulgare]|uniref:hypothetical protein n=1 Tax=Ketogulonicigenium vulgare TaxID=92945 RepID=UPI0023590103|nr:hypothetical protein [Ketogulonicigenium vulgare]
MYENPKQFLDALGGYRSVAMRLGKGSTTLHGYLTAGRFPARFFDAMVKLSREKGALPPPDHFFTFDPLLPISAAPLLTCQTGAHPDQNERAA